MHKGCCYNCPDRTIEPNCHTTCERYLKDKKELFERNEKARECKKIKSTIEKNNKHRVNTRKNTIFTTHVK